MEFDVSLAAYYYGSESDVKKYEALGFKFERLDKEFMGYRYKVTERRSVSVEINSLEELLDFVKKYDEIILYANGDIQIYNDYIE